MQARLATNWTGLLKCERAIPPARDRGVGIICWEEYPINTGPSRIATLAAPTNLGLQLPEPTSVPGVPKAPEAPRNAGLHRQLGELGAADVGVVVPHRYVVLGQVLTQARRVLAGTTHIPDPVVSVVDPTARPIVKGKVGKPVEFGYKAALDEVDDGFIVGWETAVGNRPDIRFLPPALDRHRRLFQRPPGKRRWTGTAGTGRPSRISKRSTSTCPKRGKKSTARQAGTGSPAFGACNAGGRGRAHRAGETPIPAAAQPLPGRSRDRLAGRDGDRGRQSGMDAPPGPPPGGDWVALPPRSPPEPRRVGGPPRIRAHTPVADAIRRPRPRGSR